MEEQAQENLEMLQALCQELFRTNYEDETPFGKSVIRRALREREKENKIQNKLILLEDCNFSVRCFNSLRAFYVFNKSPEYERSHGRDFKKYTHLNSFVNHTAKELLSNRGFGQVSLREVETCMEEHGLSLKK